jgi:glycosyltransferase involved in cell wall biosynthesis
MEQLPKFSVLMASYNNAEFIEEALESVLAQTYLNWEVVIVDDASTDHTRKVLDQYKDNKQIRTIYRSDNLGCGATKREAVALAQGAIAGFLDPDDKLEKDALERMVEVHLAHPKASLVYSLFYSCDEQLQNPYIPAWIGPLPKGELNLKANRISHFATFKTVLYQKTDGIDASLKKAVDKDLYFRLEEVGSIVFVDAPLYYYRVHPGGIASGKNKKLKALKWAFYVKKTAYLRRKQLGRDNIGWKDLVKDYRYLKKKELRLYLKSGDLKKSLPALRAYLFPEKSSILHFEKPD